MSVRRPLPRQHGAILIESLVALAVLSLGAVSMFAAFDYLEATSRTASQRNADSRVLRDPPEIR